MSQRKGESPPFKRSGGLPADWIMYMKVFRSWCWRFSGALDDRCDLSTDCMEEYLSGKLPALRGQSVCISGFLPEALFTLLSPDFVPEDL
ncbi:hypothetical protein AMECASPLE_036081 [Ameca splendens]|uniref:Uncharacterized protein n=1 Tax=Ameca splendens TaxID=208324 RepID=A0ABV0Y7F3_9TELE